MERQSFLNSLFALREYLTSVSTERESTIYKAFTNNPWFIPEFTKAAMESIAEDFLDEEKINSWLVPYSRPFSIKRKIAIIMAGNVPLVGFHDLLCVLASGQTAVIKLSDKDPFLLPFITDQWIKINPSLASDILYTERLDGFDAVIATGSNNSARYFEYYFRTYPHILRQNRNGVAVLTGQESMEDLKNLARDIFLFFGLGCRNVSKVYVPEGYDFTLWQEAIEDWKYLGDHNKYKNNLDYNYTIYIINKVAHLQLGHLILKEDEAIASRIGCVHYSYYQNNSALADLLNEKKEEIQCVLSNTNIDGWESIGFGQSQRPRLDQYADGVDIMQFLNA